MITKEMTIAEVISRYPWTIELFRRYTLTCDQCQLSEIEDILHGTAVHHIDTERFIHELNELIHSRQP